MWYPVKAVHWNADRVDSLGPTPTGMIILSLTTKMRRVTIGAVRCESMTEERYEVMSGYNGSHEPYFGGGVCCVTLGKSHD